MTALEISRPDARRAALGGLIDYAGLFPPAALDMVGAVAGFRTARSAPADWMVNRFICPAARLEELVANLVPTMTTGEDPWRISVTASPGWTDSLARDAGAVRTFVDTMGTAARVELVEIRVPPDEAADPQRLAGDAADVLRAFDAMVLFEVPWQSDPADVFDVLAALREDTSDALGVKIRCGGVEAAEFPDPGAVARFISAAAARSLPMKATAGLHHPFRHVDSESRLPQHGFMNLLVASALASLGFGTAILAEVLADQDPASFLIERRGVSWRDLSIGPSELTEMRSTLFIGYGSCSFEEPVAELTTLGVLPA